MGSARSQIAETLNESNFESDPLFVDAVAGDYRLKNVVPNDVSPCIDAGANALLAGNLDVDRLPRIRRCVADLGAHEYDATPLYGPQPEPNPVIKSQHYSFIPGNVGIQSAIRARLVNVHRPAPPPTGTPDLSIFDNQVRWLGKPFQKVGDNSSTPIYVFPASTMVCDPVFSEPTGDPPWDWGNVVLHAGGQPAPPDSTIEVQFFEDEGCPQILEGMFSAPLTLNSTRFGDAGSGGAGSPDGIANVIDVGIVVDQVKGVIPASLSTTTWVKAFTFNGPVNVVDIGSAVDAVKGFPYPHMHTPTFCPCADEALILADIDADGDIDEDDEALAETTPVYFVVNSDDDNLNGVEDYLDDGPVFGEDDLIEVRLGSKCPPLDHNAWWSISWDEPDPQNPVLRVWLHPDKSDGNGGPGTAIANGLEYGWPVPGRVWLESLANPGDIIDVVVSTSDNTVQTSAARAQPPFAILKTRTPCTPAPDRYWTSVHQFGNNITGAGAEITTSPLQPLCGEGAIGIAALSAAFITVNSLSPGYLIWAQVGYGREKRKDQSHVGPLHIYAETIFGPDKLKNRDIFIRPNFVPEPGPWAYDVFMPSALFGQWLFSFEGISFHSFEHPIWAGTTGSFVGWQTELINREDKRAGDPDVPCFFYDLRVGFNWASHVWATTNSSNAVFEPPTPGSAEWGLQWLGPTEFKVWDKFP